MVGRLSITERTYRTLAERILSGALAPGARLDANAIATADGVSPTPVRNALNRLVGAGLLVSHSNEGFFTSPCSEQDLRDLYDCCGAMLSLAVARAANARRRTMTAADKVANIDGGVDGGIGLQTETAFCAIMSLCSNKRLRSAFDDVNIRLRPARNLECGLIANQAAELGRIRSAYGARAFADLDLLLDAYHRRRLRCVTRVVARMHERAGDVANLSA